jgi:hypothetical protein
MDFANATTTSWMQRGQMGKMQYSCEPEVQFLAKPN